MNTGRGKKSAKRPDKSVAKSATGLSSHQHPVLKFLLLFGVLLAAFYMFIAFAPSYSKRFIPFYHHLIAKVSGDLLWIPFARRFEQAQRAAKFYNALDQLDITDR